MQKTRRRTTSARRGKVLIMSALLVPAFMAFIALGADLTVISTGQGQLKVAADAASLAGAMKLVDNQRLINTANLLSNLDLSSETSAAQSQAKLVAQSNLVLGLAPVILDNPSNSATGDVVVGYFSPLTRSWTAPPLASSLAPLTNAVLVTTQRSSDHGGLLPAFFSRVWGYPGTAESVQSIAMVQNYPIAGVQPPSPNTSSSSTSAPVLPIALDQSTYEAMMAGTTGDAYSYNSATGAVTSGPDGVPETMVYPIGNQPGNWGTVDLGISSNSTNVLVNQILYGMTASQLANLPGGQLQLDSSLSPPSLTVPGNPGISGGLQSALSQIIGRPSIIPIYSAVAGNGANTQYKIVAFQSVRLMAVNFTGTPKYVVAQPAYVQNSMVVANTNVSTWPAGWNWTQGGVIKVHLVR